MALRIDVEETKKHGDLLPGGDIRILGNQWLRAAWKDSQLSKVPRERQVRHALYILTKKTNLRRVLRLQWFELFATCVCLGCWVGYNTGILAKEWERMMRHYTNGLWSRH